MRIQVFTGDQAPPYVAACRVKVCQEVGIPPGSPAAELVPAGHYFLLRDEAGTNCGMAEATFHHRVYPSWEGSIYAHLAPPPCPFEALTGIRSVFVEPGHRHQGRAFMLLCLAAAHFFRQQGARYAMATTWVARADLMRLYRRMGAQAIGTVPLSPPVQAFLFDLDRLLAHPLAREAICALERHGHPVG